ncbi:MAG: hypothetical protein ACK5RD_17310 [Aphanizomenon sp.]|nr:hypothetical protein [Nostocales cyanobacterium LE14-WE12]
MAIVFERSLWSYFQLALLKLWFFHRRQFQRYSQNHLVLVV